MAAGQETVPHKAPDALAELPPASLNALTLLLETWHRVAENSSANGMDAMAIAVAVAPCLAWNPPAGKEARKASLTMLIDRTFKALHAETCIKEAMIFACLMTAGQSA